MKNAAVFIFQNILNSGSLPIKCGWPKNGAKFHRKGAHFVALRAGRKGHKVNAFFTFFLAHLASSRFKSALKKAATPKRETISIHIMRNGCEANNLHGNKAK